MSTDIKNLPVQKHREVFWSRVSYDCGTLLEEGLR